MLSASAKDRRDLFVSTGGRIGTVEQNIEKDFWVCRVLDILMRAVHGSQIRVAEQAGRKANLVLRPLALDGQWHDFNHPGKYIELGREVALKHLDELKALVRKPTSHHEHERADNSLERVA